jgi:DNA-binding NarL/FixJ family response regulator
MPFDGIGSTRAPLHRGAVILQALTAREQQVLRAVAHGYTNRQIAAALQITIDGVKFHLKVVYGKLGAERRAQAVCIAAQSGFLSMDEMGVPLAGSARLVRSRRPLSAGRRAR